MARSTQDVIGFRRIFIMFASLVLLPSLLMSGFGVIAILNVGQADKQKRRERAEELLRSVEGNLVALLDEGDRAVREGIEARALSPRAVVEQARRDGAPVGAWVLFGTDDAVLDGEAPYVDDNEPPTDDSLRLVLLRASRSATPQRPAHVALEHARFVGVVSMQRLRDGRAVVYALDDKRLAARVALHPPGRDQLHAALQVRLGNDGPIVNALEKLSADAEHHDAPAVVDGREEVVERRLDPPFERYTLGIDGPPLRSNTVTLVYIVLMVVFLGTMATGVVITARLVYEETRLSRLKTDFVSHMSHELRTPLTSIRMFIETLRLGRASSDEERQECLDLLSRETERLSDMIERVLGYARLKAGRRLFAPQVVAIDDVVLQAVDAFRAQTIHQTGAGEVQLHMDITQGLPSLWIDREAIVEALLNLLGNAFKYGGSDRRIVVFARPGRRGRVLLGVKDHGPGLPKSEHARVFERFYQGESLLSSKKPGSGLGLAITRAIVEGLGGRIWVESEPGKGAAFVMELRPAPAHELTTSRLAGA